MPYFPDNIYQHRNIENKEGVQYDPSKSKILFAEDLKNIIDEIKKIEEVLGLQINKGYDTVKEKIERCHIHQISRQRGDAVNLSSNWQVVERLRTIYEGLSSIYKNYSDIEHHIFTLSGFHSSNTRIYTRLYLYSCVNGSWAWRYFSLPNSPITAYLYGTKITYWGMKKKSEIAPCGLDQFVIEQKCDQGTGKYYGTIIIMRMIY